MSEAFISVEESINAARESRDRAEKSFEDANEARKDAVLTRKIADNELRRWINANRNRDGTFNINDRHYVALQQQIEAANATVNQRATEVKESREYLEKCKKDLKDLETQLKWKINAKKG